VCAPDVRGDRRNPLALLELPRGLSVAELSAGFRRTGAEPLVGRIEQSFRRRLQRSRRQPAPVADRLGGAAGRPERVVGSRAAARRRDRGGTAASEAGLMDIDTSVRFRHPLVRSGPITRRRRKERRRCTAASRRPTNAELEPIARVAPRRGGRGRRRGCRRRLERSRDVPTARRSGSGRAFLERPQSRRRPPASATGCCWQAGAYSGGRRPRRANRCWSRARRPSTIRLRAQAMRMRERSLRRWPWGRDALAAVRRGHRTQRDRRVAGARGPDGGVRAAMWRTA